MFTSQGPWIQAQAPKQQQTPVFGLARRCSGAHMQVLGLEVWKWHKCNMKEMCKQFAVALQHYFHILGSKSGKRRGLSYLC